ncbi:MAG: GyrI-like domain-containing protein [Clostridia bacterium]|nr:GyrI-like domain-containing protein [Clostridia bacterium]
MGLGITREHLLAGDYGQYDGAFLVLDREDRFRGEALELPGGECFSLRFRGSHPQAPEHYRALMSFLRENGLEPAGFSREITLIDEGLTRDPEQFVTEIVIPVTPHKNAVFAGTRNRDASAEA